MPVAIVTASDSGIGKATAVALAEAGFDLGITWNTDEDGARDTAREVEGKGRRAEIRELDLSVLPEAGEVIDELAEALGGLDVLVNNAGRGSSTPMVDMEFEEWREVLSVKLDGAFVCAPRDAWSTPVAEAGSSTSPRCTSTFRRPEPRPTAPQRLGLASSRRSWRSSSPSTGFVNAVGPGEIATPMTGEHEVDPHAGEDKPYVPLNRAGTAREIASLVVWLASPGATYATGSSFVVDGGLMLKAADQSASTG